jgi:glycosyltransferase involved in cell wall biosynthesis
VEQLANAIAELLQDPAKRATLGAAARRLIETEYSAQRMTDDYLRVYEEAIALVKAGKDRAPGEASTSQGSAR